MNKSDHLNSKMREILVDWIVLVTKNFRLSNYTLHLSVTISDNYLNKNKTVSRADFQKVGITSLMIASKIEERYSPSIEDFTWICDNSYTKKEIAQCELEILNTLDYNVCLDNIQTEFTKYKEKNADIHFLLDALLLDPSILYKYNFDEIVESCSELINKHSNYWSRCMEDISLFLSKDVLWDEVLKKYNKTKDYLNVLNDKIGLLQNNSNSNIKATNSRSCVKKNNLRKRKNR